MLKGVGLITSMNIRRTQHPHPADPRLLADQRPQSLRRQHRQRAQPGQVRTMNFRHSGMNYTQTIRSKNEPLDVDPKLIDSCPHTNPSPRW